MKLISFVTFILLVVACKNQKKEKQVTNNDLVIMTPDELNSAKPGDTLVIYENICRGCAYEESTHFEVTDSLGLVKLAKIETIDNTPPDVDRGSIDKHIYLLPQKKERQTRNSTNSILNNQQPKIQQGLLFIELK